MDLAKTSGEIEIHGIVLKEAIHEELRKAIGPEA
jgi:hypothetical protein